MSDQPQSTTQLLTLILTELKGIKAALQSKGSTQPPPARPQAQNQNSGGQGGGGANYGQKPGEELASCRDCQGPIIWRKSKAGKSYCVDPDGTYHSKTCTGR